MILKCKTKCIFIGLLLLSALMITACVNPIPPNEHVGKPPPHNYNDSYYYSDGGYYYY